MFMNPTRPAGARLGFLAIAGATGLLAGDLSAAPQVGGGGDDGAGEPSGPERIVLTGVVRDLHEREHEGGHPDFEKRPDGGFGLYCGNIDSRLGENGKPQFTGEGFKVVEQWTDSSGRPICYALYDGHRGDHPGEKSVSSTGGIESSATFHSWFNDVPGINMSSVLNLNLMRQEDGSYVFDDKEDPQYVALGGFFPIEDRLFGNPGGNPDRNFHFTLELQTEFTYHADKEQVFRFIGDDDVWVFIDGKLVIDLGGVHTAKEQYVDLGRLDLVDGENYSLAFFFAERHRTQSNFRIETTLTLQSTELPSITAAFD